MGWIAYKEALCNLDSFGQSIDFSPSIYSEAQVIEGLIATEWHSLRPIEEFALSRDKTRFARLEDEGRILEDQSIYICGCLERLKRTSLDRKIKKALFTFYNKTNCTSAKAAVEKLKSMMDIYATRIEADEELGECFNVLDSLLNAMCQQEFYSAREAWRKYVIRLLQLRIGAQQKNLQHHSKEERDQNKTFNILRQVYWWLRILQLREEGKIGAWEGIRIVSDKR